jgi:multiple sugar transport system substrate-binding protein
VQRLDHRAAAAFCLVAMVACHGERGPRTWAGATRLVFAHQPLWGDPAPLRALFDGFRRDNPDVALTTELLPNAPEVVHQHLVTTLESGRADYDVFVADVVWVPELARAGWIADLSAAFAPAELRRDFLPGPVEAVVLDGKTWAVPWYVDVGLLFYRKDLVPRAPATFDELARFAKGATARDPALAGYLWQGRQYEGLVCNGYEAAWGHGAETLRDGRVLVDTPGMRAGLAWLRATLTSGLSPASTLSAGEEEARRRFQDGRGVFLRNWPYTFAESEQPGSAVRGRVGWAALPTVSGEPGAGALGGWQLVVSASSPPERRAAAMRLIAHLTSPEANVQLALAYARNPPRRAPYRDPRLVDGAPFIAALAPIVARARPRPVTPYYVMISDVLQSEMSAVVSGIRPPEAALGRAQRLVDHLLASGDEP